MTFLFSGGFVELEVVRQNGEADLARQLTWPHAGDTARWLDIRGTVYSAQAEWLVNHGLREDDVQMVTNRPGPFPGRQISNGTDLRADS